MPLAWARWKTRGRSPGVRFLGCGKHRVWKIWDLVETWGQEESTGRNITIILSILA